jgi:hypothetical protein
LCLTDFPVSLSSLEVDLAAGLATAAVAPCKCEFASADERDREAARDTPGTALDGGVSAPVAADTKTTINNTQTPAHRPV